jgi:hypothetical protein
MDNAEIEKVIPSDSPQKNPSEITVHQIKSNHFRVIFADSVIGAATPQSRIQMALCNTRVAIPQEMVYKIDPDGVVGSEVTEERVGRKGLVRELEVQVVMDVEFAESLRDWLNEKILLCKLENAVSNKERKQ